MKTSFIKKSVMGVLVLTALSLAACAKKDDSASGRSANRQNSAGIAPTQNSCAAGTQLEGKIYDAQASYGSNFEQQVKAFVSATLEPDALGTISGNISDATGVDFTASFPFDSNNQLIADSASITIKIFDSYAKQTYNGQVVPPYEVSFSKAKSGTIDRHSRRISVVFEDDYGSITFDGTYDNTYVRGTVSFNNYKSVSGSPQAGELGDFMIFQCAMIK